MVIRISFQFITKNIVQLFLLGFACSLASCSKVDQVYDYTDVIRNTLSIPVKIIFYDNFSPRDSIVLEKDAVYSVSHKAADSPPREWEGFSSIKMKFGSLEKEDINCYRFFTKDSAAYVNCIKDTITIFNTGITNKYQFTFNEFGRGRNKSGEWQRIYPIDSMDLKEAK